MQHSIATHNGKITITNPKTGNHRTFRIRTQADSANFAPGQRIVSLLTGPDNQEDYRGFGFVTEEGRILVWRKKRGNGKPSEFDIFARMLTEPERYEAEGVTYQFSTRCRRCNHELTDPTSISLGIGPVCRGER